MNKASTPHSSHNTNLNPTNVSQMSYCNSISSIDISSSSFSNTDMQASSSCSSSNSSLKENRKRRKKSSFVWEWFRLSSDKKATKCTLCTTTYDYQSTTSQMKYHLGVKHSIYDKPKPGNSLNFNSLVDTDCSSSSEVEMDENDATSESKKKIQQITRAIMRFVIGCNQPLSIVKSPYFKSMIHECKPTARIPSIHLMKTNLLPMMVLKLIYVCKINKHILIFVLFFKVQRN